MKDIIPSVKLRTDKQGRLACRELFPPGSAFDVTRQPDGSIRVMEVVEKPVRPANVRLEKRAGFTVGMSDQPISAVALKAALAEFPRSSCSMSTCCWPRSGRIIHNTRGRTPG